MPSALAASYSSCIWFMSRPAFAHAPKKSVLVSSSDVTPLNSSDTFICFNRRSGLPKSCRRSGSNSTFIMHRWLASGRPTDPLLWRVGNQAWQKRIHEVRALSVHRLPEMFLQALRERFDAGSKTRNSLREIVLFIASDYDAIIRYRGHVLARNQLAILGEM